MQKVVEEGLVALTPAEVSQLLTHVGLQTFVKAFTENEVCSHYSTQSPE